MISGLIIHFNDQTASFAVTVREWFAAWKRFVRTRSILNESRIPDVITDSVPRLALLFTGVIWDTREHGPSSPAVNTGGVYRARQWYGMVW